MPIVLSIVGTRPQFIKAAPVSRAFATAGVREVLVHTGQHFDAAMSDIFFKELDIPEPAYHLGVNSLNHGAMTGRMLEKIEEVLLTEKPDLALVYGDTNSTVAGALAAAKLHVPVAHVEAGLRSFSRHMPEEINRLVADHVSSLLFCPTTTAVRNLRAEGIDNGVHLVGDVMFDMTLAAIARAKQRSRILEALGLPPKGYAVATVHRAETTDNRQRLQEVIAWLEDADRQQPVVMVVHPRTRERMTRAGIVPRGIRLLDPLGYLDMSQLVHHAAAVFTDSGGLQKEAYFHRVPCITLRDATEWVETIEAGWNRLWTTSGYRPQRDIADYGTGHAAELIASLVCAEVQKN